MNVNYYGTHASADKVHEVIEFVVMDIMPRLRDKLEINIHFESNMLEDELIYADCVWEDSVRYPREFTIRVDADLPESELLPTIAHELVHVKQFARDELKYLPTRQIHRFHKSYYPDNTPEAPWEIEAEQYEEQFKKTWLEGENND